ncbi:MAG: thiolase family protein [Alphaproteobacteria bacterium]
MNNPVVITHAKRTPMGAFQGALSPLSSVDLGAITIKSLLEHVDGSAITDVIMGCVLPAGLGQAPARQAMLKAGVPRSAHAMTINKVCGSGLKTIMMAHDQLLLNQDDVIIAGGMESMTNAPYLLPNARSGYRFGHGKVMDHMALDGLEDPYNGGGTAMGVFAENTADKYGFTREDQDAFAIESGNRAINAVESGAFVQEITPCEISGRKGTTVVDTDEPPSKVLFDKIPKLKSPFRDGGTVTAANASSLTDGAAVVLMMRLEKANQLGLTPIAKVIGHATHSQEPEWFTTAPVGAIEKLYKKVSLTPQNVDLYEINEAFAVVTMAAMKDLDLDHGKVNIHGGACALGHPIGASGTRLVVTLAHALKSQQMKTGIASLCIGGGEGVALALEAI